jgi:hypothetical protein
MCVQMYYSIDFSLFAVSWFFFFMFCFCCFFLFYDFSIKNSLTHTVDSSDSKVHFKNKLIISCLMLCFFLFQLMTMQVSATSLQLTSQTNKFLSYFQYALEYWQFPFNVTIIVTQCEWLIHSEHILKKFVNIWLTICPKYSGRHNKSRNHFWLNFDACTSSI